MRRYWEDHQDARAHADLEADPYALANVCTFSAPPWLNEHYAAAQRAVFDRLLARVPGAPGRALDVGCGGARWSERLDASGWEVTGIDLQQALIEHNRRRLPSLRFERVALADFVPAAPFSLVCSVTVLGHVPHEDQPTALEKLHAITTRGARVLALENVHDQTAHVFSNPVGEWIARFAAAGFSCEAVLPYDFNPCLRLVALTRRMAGRTAGRRQADPEPHDYMAPPPQRSSAALAAERLYAGLLALAGAVDGRVDPVLTLRGSPFPRPGHAGMLFSRN